MLKLPVLPLGAAIRGRGHSDWSGSAAGGPDQGERGHRRKGVDGTPRHHAHTPVPARPTGIS